MTERASDRLWNIQVLRFVAAALVVVTHTTFYAHERVASSVAIWRFGEVGVPIFFAVSGVVMVVTTHKLAADWSSAWLFLRRRFVRIVPLYWLATAAKVLIAISVPAVVAHNHFRPDHALKSFLFIPYFNGDGEVRPIHGVGWTLLHEVYFYLVFALALMAKMKPALPASLVIVGAYVAGRYLEPQSAAWVVMTHLVNLNFVVGMLVGSALAQPHRERFRVAVLLLLVAACAASVGSLLPLEPLVPGAMLVVLATAPLAQPALASTAIALGDSSYSLYLFHPFIAPGLVVLTAKFAAIPPALAITITVAATIVAAHLIHLVVERPIVDRLRTRVRA